MSQSRPKKVKKHQPSEAEKNRLGVYQELLGLPLETGHMSDYAVGHTLDENGMLVCHPNPMRRVLK